MPDRLVEPLLVRSEVCGCQATVNKGVVTFVDCGTEGHADRLSVELVHLALEAGNVFHYDLADGRSGQARPCGCFWQAEGGLLKVHPCDAAGHRDGLLSVLSVFARAREVPLEIVVGSLDDVRKALLGE